MHDDSPLSAPSAKNLYFILSGWNRFFLWLFFFFSRYLSVQTRSTVTVAWLFPPHSLCLTCRVCFVYDTKRLNKKMNECVVGVYIAVKNKAAWFQKDEDVSRLAEMVFFFFFSSLISSSLHLCFNSDDDESTIVFSAFKRRPHNSF